MNYDTRTSNHVKCSKLTQTQSLDITLYPHPYTAIDAVDDLVPCAHKPQNKQQRPSQLQN